MCEECVTKIDGINQCRTCLAKAARGATKRPEQERSPVGQRVAIALTLMLLTSLVWWMLSALFSGGADRGA